MYSFRELCCESPETVRLPKLKQLSSQEKECHFNQNEKKRLCSKLYKYYDFLIKINLSNNQVIKWGADNRNYRAAVGKGNNFQIIKQAFKRR